MCLHHLKHHLKPSKSQKGWGEEGLMPSLTGFNVVVSHPPAPPHENMDDEMEETRPADGILE